MLSDVTDVETDRVDGPILGSFLFCEVFMVGDVS
jgi:hypothetical protein